MKKLSETKNLKYVIVESISLILGILTLIFVFLPAVFEEDQPDSSIFSLMVGNDKLATSPILIVGFVLLMLGIIVTLTALILLLLKKSNSRILTILSIVSMIGTLVGSAILACAIFLSGFTELNSALGFNQGQWGIKAGTFLVPIFGLLSTFSSFPSAVVILHEKDLQDENANKQNA